MFNVKHCWGEDYFARVSFYSVRKLFHKKGAIALISNLASLLIITEPPVNLLPVSIWRFGSDFTSLYLHNGLITGLLSYTALRGKCPNKEFFLISIFLHSDWKRENTDQKLLCIAAFSTQSRLLRQTVIKSPFF